MKKLSFPNKVMGWVISLSRDIIHSRNFMEK